MTLEQVKTHCEINLTFYKGAKKQLWDIKEQKWDGSKKLWTEAVVKYSAKIDVLEEILEFIDLKL
jgi:hypothetical protein